MNTLAVIKELLTNKEVIGMFLFTFIVLVSFSRDYTNTIKVLRKALIVYAILKLIFEV